MRFIRWRVSLSSVSFCLLTIFSSLFHRLGSYGGGFGGLLGGASGLFGGGGGLGAYG